MNINTFEVSIYGNLTPFEKNPLLSSARVRIFYKGLNRNRTYITDEFAEKLIASLPYTPVSGIWDDDKKDYTDHGESREEGRIYGLVPEEPNVQWEQFEDKDGVIREYCCCDVVLFTARYADAAQIINKPQSMELYPKTLKGEWIVKDGVKCFRFTDGCFIGLQVLGDDVEPCFEGAAFYAYSNSLKEMVEILKNYTINGGTKDMVINYKLSDREKYDALFNLLNPGFCEEGGWTVDYSICDIYDEYALIYQYETAKYFRQSYAKNDETNTVELGEATQVFILDISEAELNALNVLRAANGGTFSEMDAKYQSLVDENSTLKGDKDVLAAEKAELDTTVASLNEKVEELNATISNGADTIATLNSKIEELNNTVVDKDANIENITGELNSLKEFKETVERNEKLDEIGKYSMLSEDIITEFQEKVDTYTLKELQAELKAAYVDANASTIFSNQSNLSVNHFIPKADNEPSGTTGAAGLINKHKHNGGK